MSKAVIVVLLALGAAGLASCNHLATCDNHEKAQTAKLLAKTAYDGAHYDQAKELYNNAVEWCSDNYDARMGLAHSSRMLGNQLFQQADQSAQAGKLPAAQKVFRQANDNHIMADRLFRTAMSERPDDPEPHYGLGLLWYERATSPISAPYPRDDTENRQRERDEAIKEFTLVIKSPTASSQSLRYRGLAYLAADRLEEGAKDLKVYHDSRQDLYNKIVSTWPSTSENDKKRKDIALREVEKEIDNVREVLLLELGELDRRSKELKKKETPTPKEVQEVAHLSSQQILLEGMIRSFALTNMGEVEQVIVKRCREYLESFNRGNLQEVLSFLGARKGEEKQLREAVSAKVAQGTQFRKVVFRSADVTGDKAMVGFVCDLVFGQVNHPDTEVILRWRLIGGQWLITDHP